VDAKSVTMWCAGSACINARVGQAGRAKDFTSLFLVGGGKVGMALSTRSLAATRRKRKKCQPSKIKFHVPNLQQFE
jgi:hypothetical protein